MTKIVWVGLAGVVAAFVAMPACATEARGESLPRLAGIVVAPEARLAIFIDAVHKATVVLHEGDAIGDYRIQRIASGYAELTGPEGQRIVTVEAAEPDPAAAPVVELPALPAVLEGARHEGGVIGQLAAERDGCAQVGFSAALVPDAETQLSAMLDAMADLPTGTGVQKAHAAPAKALAAAMRSGFEEARARTSGTAYEANICAEVMARWASEGHRYGLR